MVEKLGQFKNGWSKLKEELLRRQLVGEAVVTIFQGVSNWIKEVGDDYVVLLSERSSKGKRRTITRNMLEDTNLEIHKKLGQSRIILALWEIGGYPIPK